MKSDELDLVPWCDLPEEPISTVGAIQRFDEEVCKAGHKRFMRRLHDLERKEILAESRVDLGEEFNAVLVTEIAPGLRTRMFVHGFPVGTG